MKFTHTLAVAAATAMVAEANVAQTFRNFGLHVAQLNEGMMRAMQSDPKANNTTCVTQATKASVEIQKLFNVGQYFDGVFNIGDFFNQLQISSIQVLSEFEKCNYNEFLIQFDGVMSHIPEVSGMGANLVTQLTQGLIGYTYDTSVYKSYFLIADAYDKWDWVSIGQGVQLFFSQLTKFEAPDVKQQVVTI